MAMIGRIMLPEVTYQSICPLSSSSHTVLYLPLVFSPTNFKYFHFWITFVPLFLSISPPHTVLSNILLILSPSPSSPAHASCPLVFSSSPALTSTTSPFFLPLAALIARSITLHKTLMPYLYVAETLCC